MNTSNWQPIETAPRDGTRIDLWVRSFDLGEGGKVTADVGHRVAGALWGKEYRIRINPVEHTYGKEECWVVQYEQDLQAVESDWTKVTHWMPLPTAPEAK